MIKDREKKEFGLWWIFISALVMGTIVVFAFISYGGK